MTNLLKRLFIKHPFITNSLTYGSLYVGAEFSQQYITKKILIEPKQKIDTAIIGRYAILGTCMCSPTLYLWYKWLDDKYPGKTKRIIMKKLLLDQFVITPVLLASFYTWMALLEGADEPFHELKQKYIPTFIKSCLFWLPAQSVNFLFLPSKYRVIYVAVCGFIWVNILCWIKRQKIVLNETNQKII